ncbi:MULTISPECIES: hypothetical protein [Serratia]|jgi:hypothetical protein|uniref:Uncharacterized protein n=1 Tax=Serratia liquefaciens TaxID=614 RepID=A0A515CRC2_SERLI|nr:hypothetical protein [Serratia liquefaciens]AGQ32389.1 hypothetical protein M495_18550 [Serratia liquefaciens ATCC 27592]MBF8107265.1 hypothetical protein [Serratia liquefaciens]QDL30724.1 hypothetical protein EGO53_02480 [Serratia liquefaciens]QIC88345.1 hypothetical protein F0336_18600 [Serratia liquefaciens]CAB1223652.1 hypothetical protein SFB10_3614 [Serratia liquefaciens]
MDEERMTYGEIREMILGCFYDCCRNILYINKKTGEKSSYDGLEIGYASYQCENTPFSPIEKLMFEVFTLILRAGRGPKKAEDITRDGIYLIINETPLSILIKDISDDEKRDLLYDMELLGLLEKPE